MENNADGIFTRILQYLNIGKLEAIVLIFDEICKSSGYGDIIIRIRDRRVTIIEKTIKQDIRNL
jgi:hypothetical protein